MEDIAKDAARWRVLEQLLRQRMTPTQCSYKFVETDPMFCEEKEIDMQKVVDFVIASKARPATTP